MKLSVSKSSAAEIAKTAKAISICLVSCYLKVRYLFITSLHQLRYPDLLREMLPTSTVLHYISYGTQICLERCYLVPTSTHHISYLCFCLASCFLNLYCTHCISYLGLFKELLPENTHCISYLGLLRELLTESTGTHCISYLGLLRELRTESTHCISYLGFLREVLPESTHCFSYYLGLHSELLLEVLIASAT